MPELPEVETIKRDLSFLTSSQLKALEVYDRPYLEKNSISLSSLKALEGQTLVRLSRKGKYLFFHFSRSTLGFHLGLTGSLTLNDSDETIHNHKHKVLRLDFSQGMILFSDMRKFGKIFHFIDDEGFSKFLNQIGPDALEIELSEFKECLKKHTKPIKSVFLDQKIISGIGNIYADEILFRAGISPLRPANILSEDELQKLYKVMKDVLNLAIELRGSTIKDYVDGFGRHGMFQTQHLVYQKYGKPCPRCGNVIEKTIVSGRTTSFCPKCQR